MKMAYLLVYNDALGSREDVKRCLEGMSEVINWRYDLPHSFYIVSEEDAHTLGRIIRERIGAGRFIITEVTPNKGGWLPSDTWYLLNNKTRKPKE
jgi:hypothetical protein